MDVLAWVGVNALAVVLGEMHLRVTPAVGVALAGGMALATAVRQLFRPSWALMIKEVLVLAACCVGFVHTRHRALFRWLTVVNVLALAVPATYHGLHVLALELVVLAALTPRAFTSRPAVMSWGWAYVSTIVTYFLFSEFNANGRLGALASVVPMAIGLLTGSFERAMVYRFVGMLVGFILPGNIWAPSSIAPPGRFRPEHDRLVIPETIFRATEDRLKDLARWDGAYAVACALSGFIQLYKCLSRA